MNQITRNDVTSQIRLAPSEVWALRYALQETSGLPFTFGDITLYDRDYILNLTAEIEAALVDALQSYRASGLTSSEKAAATKVLKHIDGALDGKAERLNREAQGKFDWELAKIASLRDRVERGFVAPTFVPVFRECYDKRHFEWAVEDTSSDYGHSRSWDIQACFTIVDGRPVMRYQIDAPMVPVFVWKSGSPVLVDSVWENGRTVLVESNDEMIEIVNQQAALFSDHLVKQSRENFAKKVADLAYLDAMAASTELVSA